MCKRAAGWRSGRERERRTSVCEEKRYDRNKGGVSERGSGQSGEWRLIGNWNDESNRRDLRRWRNGGYKWISRGELSSVTPFSTIISMSSSSSSETSGVHFEPTVFVKNTFQTISHCNSARYSHPRLALLNSAHYPEEKAILDAAQASAQRSQTTDLQLGDSLFFTDFKFFGAVAVLHILDNPISMERKALRAHIECGIYNWTQNDFYGSLSEAGAVRYVAAGDARLFQYCMDLDKEVSLSQPILV